MSATNKLVTLEEVKRNFGVDSADKDTLFEGWISGVSDVIEELCDAWFVARDVDEILNGNAQQKIATTRAPVIGFASMLSTENQKLGAIQYRNDAASAWTNIETVSSYIMFDPNNPYWIYLQRTVFPGGILNVRLNYQAGYSTVPQRVKDVAIEMLQERWNESKVGNDQLGKASKSLNAAVGTETTSFRDLATRFKSELSLYARLRVG